MCIVSTVRSVRVVGNVSVCGVNKGELRKKKSLVSKETVELHQWGNNKLKFGIKQLSNF